MNRLFLLIIVSLLLVNELIAGKPNSVKDLCVMPEAIIDENTSKIKLSWQVDTNSYKYYIYRKTSKDSAFGTPYATLNFDVLSFTDTITSGLKYEYMIEKDAWDYWAYGYLFSGFKIPLSITRGTVLILCDNTLYNSIYDNLKIFQNDLAGDGWNSEIILAPRAEVFDKSKVAITKKIIVDYYNDNPNLNSLVIVGRVAVPYSGSFAVDGHSPEHDGAWPTDNYYGIFTDKWTDTLTNVKAIEPRLHNIPDDGKYDQLIIPDDVKLSIGRIDFFNLPAFSETEIDLLNRYFSNNHLFRNGLIKVPDSTIVNDYFGLVYKEGFATNGYSNFAALSGRNTISEEELRYSTQDKNYLFAYGCGAGSYNSVSQTLYSDDLSVKPFKAAFAMLFGSYNGDWDSPDNVLRSCLAAQPLGLAVMWAGRPNWFLHHLALGETIGYSTKLSQNSYPDEYQAASPYARRFNHIALMGDPTLRTHYPESINRIIAKNVDDKIEIIWSKSTEDDILGYYIYRSSNENSKFVLINDTPVLDTIFIDSSPLPGINYYMVRVAKKQNTASGNYINQSTGKISNGIIFPIISDDEFVRLFPIPADNFINLIFMKTTIMSTLKVNIFDLEGKLINGFDLATDFITIPIYQIPLTDTDGNLLSQGVYWLEIITNNKRYIKKFVKK